jgi:hypothetical protein
MAFRPFDQQESSKIVCWGRSRNSIFDFSHLPTYTSVTSEPSVRQYQSASPFLHLGVQADYFRAAGHGFAI